MVRLRPKIIFFLNRASILVHINNLTLNFRSLGLAFVLPRKINYVVNLQFQLILHFYLNFNWFHMLH